MEPEYIVYPIFFAVYLVVSAGLVAVISRVIGRQHGPDDS